MSIIEENEYGTFISHEELLTQIGVSNEVGEVSYWRIKPSLFDIQTEFKKNIGRNSLNSDVSKNGKIVEQLYNSFIQQCNLFKKSQLVNDKKSKESNSEISIDVPKRHLSCDESKDINDKCDKEETNSHARKLANDLYEDAKDFKYGKFNGENREEFGKFTTIKSIHPSSQFLIFPNTIFFGCRIEELELNKKFSFLLLDPPWRNKYIRRRKRKQAQAGYELMWDCELKELQLGKYCKEKCLMVVWCTNSLQHQTSLKETLFPSWGFKYASTWFWLKLTKSLQPVCPFDSEGKKQPFETILIGQRGGLSIEDKPELILSVPSSIHSQKPPLLPLIKNKFPELINQEIPDDSIEFFARYLTPGMTSVGLEVVKLQNKILFEPVGT